MENFEMMRSGSVQIPICDKTAVCELSGDFTLPDYQPEIKRLLRVSANVLPPSKYFNERQAELAGNIDYYAVYVGSDNCVYCAPLSAEYKVEVPYDLAETGEFYIGEAEGKVTLVPDMISGRVTAPRKISVKCRLRARAQIFGEMPVDESYSDKCESLQTLIGDSSSVRVVGISGEMLNVSDEIICENREEDLRVVWADGRILMSEVSSVGNTVSCRGDLYLKLLLCRDDGSAPYSVTRKMPLSQNLSVEGGDETLGVSAKGTVCEMNITVEEGRIGISAGVVIEAEVCRSERVKYVKDVYSTEKTTENAYLECNMIKDGCAVSGNFTLGDSRSLEEAGIAVGARVIDISGIAYPEEYDLEGDKCALLGKSRFSVLLEKDGEYSITDVELPFSYKTSATGAFDKAHFSCEIISARARIDGERIGIDAEVSVSGIVTCCESESMLSSVGFGEDIRRDRGEFVICYPMPEDSLWSIAKRYGARIDALSENNGIASDSAPDDKSLLKDVKYLVI